MDCFTLRPTVYHAVCVPSEVLAPRPRETGRGDEWSGAVAARQSQDVSELMTPGHLRGGQTREAGPLLPSASIRGSAPLERPATTPASGRWGGETLPRQVPAVRLRAQMAAARGSRPPAPGSLQRGPGSQSGRWEEVKEKGWGRKKPRPHRGPRSWSQVGQTPRLQAAGALPWPFLSFPRPTNWAKDSETSGQKHPGRQEGAREAQICAAGARGGERRGESSRNGIRPPVPGP